MTAPPRNLAQHRLLRAFCDELARCGVVLACTSPGSRCAPILLALAREPRIRAISHLDERCAGFFAVGAAKASGRPVAVTCTSGTAAAELAPAVIEAFQAAVPLIVLTADRPPELRDVGAGQTIDQVKLYGGAVKWYVEPDLASAEATSIRTIRALACRVAITAATGRPGPVHVNLPLRDPLVTGGPLDADERGDGSAGGRPGGRPWLAPPQPGRTVLEPIAIAPRTVIVAGHGTDPIAAHALAARAAEAGIPLLADPLSGGRRGAAAIARYDHILRSPELAAELAPELVVRVGDLPTSKPLREWLGSRDCARSEQIALVADEAWPDPSGTLSRRVVARLTDAIGALTGAAAPGWLDRWRELDAAASAAIDGALAGEPGVSEPAVAAALGRILPAEATVFVAASMPVRDIESFTAVRANPAPVLSNRGANGIDGTVSAALGAAAAGSGPVVLLIGDVAFAYDLGGLLAARRYEIPLTVVLLNNDGGGIFHFLPIAREADAFGEHIATPHGLDFSVAATLYGAGYERITDLRRFEAAVGEAVAATGDGSGGRGVRILEVRTGREANLDLHRRIAAGVAAQLATVGRPAAPDA